MSIHKIQSEFINPEIGRTHFEQYFQTQTENKISIEDYQETKDTLIYFMDLLSQGQRVVLSIKSKPE
jgi:hypothetical protein